MSTTSSTKDSKEDRGGRYGGSPESFPSAQFSVSSQHSSALEVCEGLVKPLSGRTQVAWPFRCATDQKPGDGLCLY